MFRTVIPVVAVVLGVSACTSGPQPMDTASHDQEILAWRASKDAMFRSGAVDGNGRPESPLPPADRATFTGLSYFPIDAAYQMPAVLREDRSASRLIIELPTSSTEMRRMQRVGTLSFSLKGTPFTLTAFAEEDAAVITRLFVPFRDETSGADTYGGGRYLELDRTSTSLYDLDFNRAYHPFCVFNVSYVCPVPPPENRLSVAVEAGERLPDTPKR